MRTFRLCLLLILQGVGGVQVIRENRTQLINCIKDFFLLLEQPYRASTNTLCWDKRSFMQLTKTLMRANILVTPSKGKLTTYWPHEQQMFVVDLNCNDSTDILSLASKLNLLEFPFHWILIDNPNRAELMPSLEMFVRSKIYLIQRLGEHEYKIISKYRLNREHPKYFSNDIARWTNSKFAYYNKLIDSRNRSDLHRIVMNVSHVLLHNDTLKDMLLARHKHIEPYTKVNMPMTLHVLEATNAVGFMIPRPTWGYMYSNMTSFIGMMGDMQNKTAEICSTPSYYLRDRLVHIDAIESTTPTTAKFVFRAPPLSYVKNVYVLPFHYSVWWASVGLIILIPVVFYVITYWEQNDEAFNSYEVSYNSVSRLNPSILEIMQIQLGAVAQQGSEAEPISRSGRIATFALFLSFMALYTSYSANIVALLQSTTDSIQTLEDLLHSNLKVGVEDTPFNKFYITSQPGEVQRAIYNKKVKPGEPHIFMNIKTGVRRMRTEYFAYHTECTTIYKEVSDTFQEHEKCGLMEIEFFDFFEPYYCIRKNTTYSEIIKNPIKKMKERGIVYRNYNRIYLKKPKCQGQGGNFLSVTFNDCYAAFYIFGSGLVISTIVMVLEKIYYRKMVLKSRKIIKITVEPNTSDIPVE